MLPVAFAVGWFGYGLATWGYCLLKGWDISFAQWFSPAHPYTWPAPPAEPPTIPTTQINPTGRSGGKTPAPPNMA